MPLEAHQAAFAANGAAEGLDAWRRVAPQQGRQFEQASAAQSTGRKLVDGVAQVAQNGAAAIRRFWKGKAD